MFPHICGKVSEVTSQNPQLHKSHVQGRTTLTEQKLWFASEMFFLCCREMAPVSLVIHLLGAGGFRRPGDQGRHGTSVSGGEEVARISDKVFSQLCKTSKRLLRFSRL